MTTSEWISLISVPFFSGAIGYVTNWTGVWMLFYPVRFWGFRVPGLAPLVHLVPRRIQQIPGFMHGAVGWQGIIPSRAAKMGSLAVDKGIAKVGGPRDFYEQLDPRLQEAVHARVQEQLPDIVHDFTDEMGENIDQLLDTKLMVIRRMEAEPELANRVYLEVGRRELRFIINFGFFFGFLLGVPTAIITEVLFHQWWLLPLFGIFIGYTTNLLAIWMIFEPVEPRRIGRFTIQGLFPAPPGRGGGRLRQDHLRRHS